MFGINDKQWNPLVSLLCRIQVRYFSDIVPSTTQLLQSLITHYFWALPYIEILTYMA
jgi:hypothetical protein